MFLPPPPLVTIVSRNHVKMNNWLCLFNDFLSYLFIYAKAISTNELKMLHWILKETFISVLFDEFQHYHYDDDDRMIYGLKSKKVAKWKLSWNYNFWSFMINYHYSEILVIRRQLATRYQSMEWKAIVLIDSAESKLRNQTCCRRRRRLFI